MSQTKLASFVESNINTLLGFVVSVLTWRYIVTIFYPNLEPYAGWGESIGITLIFTVISVFRNYAVRRVSNWISLSRP